MGNQYTLLRDPNFWVVFIFGISAFACTILFMEFSLLLILILIPIIIIATAVLMLIVVAKESSKAKSDPSYGSKSWVEKISFKTLGTGFLAVVGISVAFFVVIILAGNAMFNPG